MNGKGDLVMRHDVPDPLVDRSITDKSKATNRKTVQKGVGTINQTLNVSKAIIRFSMDETMQ